MNRYVDNYEMRVSDWGFSQDQDFSPPDFRVMKDPRPWKDRLRRLAYPWLIPLLSARVRRRLRGLGLPADWQLVWGARGQGGRYMVHRVNQALPIRGANVLLLGVGLGREIEFWRPYRPASLLGVDVLNFDRAWGILKRGYPDLRLDFRRVRPDTLEGVPDAGCDIISSENVFEHVQDLRRLCAECARALRPGGILFSTFGPLWFTWSGDHFSTNRPDGDGFAHLRKNFAAYQEDARRLPYRDGMRADGRVWLLQGLFSRLRPREYVDICRERLRVEHVRAHVSAQAWERRLTACDDLDGIVARNGLEPWEPLVSGLEILARKP